MSNESATDSQAGDLGDFLPSAGWAALEERANIRRRTRQFFDERGFVEVETPVLSADSVVDLHLDPIPVTLFDDPTQPTVGPQFWLQTSPEFGMKRLLAAGAERIYQFSRAFRGGERGRLHNPEFTILEWYRVGDDYQQGIELLAALAETALAAGPVQRLAYADAFRQHAGLDPLTASGDDFRDCSRRLELTCPFDAEAASVDDWRHWLLAECVEPALGFPQPVILFDFPPSQAALARIRDAKPPVAERYELFFRGVELANGYHELLDGNELRRRVQRTNQQRVAAGKYELPEGSRLMDAMLQHKLPACCGTALGFDRLVMLAVGATSIDQVMAFPIDRA